MNRLDDLDETYRNRIDQKLADAGLTGPNRPWFFDIPFNELDLTVRAYNLSKQCVQTLGDYAYYSTTKIDYSSDGKLLKLRNFGKQTAKEMQEAAKLTGFLFADDLDNPELIQERLKTGHAYWTSRGFAQKYNPTGQTLESLTKAASTERTKETQNAHTQEFNETLKEMLGKNADNFSIPLRSLIKHEKFNEHSQLYRLHTLYDFTGEVALLSQRKLDQETEGKISNYSFEILKDELTQLGLSYDMETDIKEKIALKRLEEKRVQFKEKYDL